VNPIPENPYVGPRTFTEQDKYFFGRDQESRDLVALIAAEKLVLFYAQSGAGKSSLIRKRLRPDLRTRGFEVLPIGRVSGALPEEIKPDQIGNIFIFNLLASLNEGMPDGLKREVKHLTHENLPDFLGEEKALPAEAPPIPFVLVIDQFEEIITTHQDRWRERDDFFIQLRQAMARHSNLWLVLTMREDYIAALDPYTQYLPNRLRTRFYMKRMNRESALDAITKPAMASGLPFAPQVAENLVENLSQIRIPGQAEPRSGQFVEPVQLQVVCWRLWENLRQKDESRQEITAQDVEQLGHVDTALRQFYEETIIDTVQATRILENRLRDWFENEVITEAGTRGMVYRGDKNTGNLPTPVVDYLAQKFILRPVVRTGGTWYELVHDRFAQPIKEANHAWRLDQPIFKFAQDWADSGRSREKLLDGRQLSRFLDTNWRTLGPLVVEFMEASQELQQQQEALLAAEREAQRQRELEQQRALAEEQRKRAEEQEQAAIRQRKLSRIAYIIGGIAFILAIVAALFGVQSQENAAAAHENAAVAQMAEQTAVAEERRALEAEAEARILAETAVASEAEARSRLADLSTSVADQVRTLEGLLTPAAADTPAAAQFTATAQAAATQLAQIKTTQTAIAVVADTPAPTPTPAPPTPTPTVSPTVSPPTFTPSPTAAPEQSFGPVRQGENPYIYGLHDRGGEHLMVVDGQAKGWVLVTEEIGSNPQQRGGGDYRNISDRGLGVIIRLNNAYGPDGTLPREERCATDFAQRAANFVQDSVGAHIWVIGNEMNSEREQPRRAGANEAEPITPRRYAECFKSVRAKIKSLPGHAADIVVTGAILPWNPQTPYEADPQGRYPANRIAGAPGEYPYFGFFGDPIQYLNDMLVALGPENVDGIALHAYSHGYSPELIFSELKMGPPFQDQYYDFYTYRDQMNAIPENMRHLPVYLTEMNGDLEVDGSAWPFGNNGWIKNAYQEINRWNQSERQPIRAAILFRWQRGDPWSIDGKSEVQQDFLEAIAQDYRWTR